MDWSNYTKREAEEAMPLWTAEKIRARLVSVLDECQTLKDVDVSPLECADEFFMKFARELPKRCDDASRLDATFKLLNSIWEELLANEYKELRNELVEWWNTPVGKYSNTIYTSPYDVGRVRGLAS